eukprot:NODE_540_length_6251_cov_1.082250.p4 type:complete len:236 gc:universal NODE_540_length_6251_cov_1.082250:3780-4487(+)
MILNLIGDNQRHDKLHRLFSIGEKGSNMKLILLTIAFGMMTVGQLQKQILGILQTCPSERESRAMYDLILASQNDNGDRCSLLSNHPLAFQFLNIKSRELSPLLKEFRDRGGSIDDLLENVEHNKCKNSRLQKRNKRKGSLLGAACLGAATIASVCTWWAVELDKRVECDPGHTEMPKGCLADKNQQYGLALGMAITFYAVAAALGFCTSVSCYNNNSAGETDNVSENVGPNNVK